MLKLCPKQHTTVMAATKQSNMACSIHLSNMKTIAKLTIFKLNSIVHECILHSSLISLLQPPPPVPLASPVTGYHLQYRVYQNNCASTEHLICYGQCFFRCRIHYHSINIEWYWAKHEQSIGSVQFAYTYIYLYVHFFFAVCMIVHAAVPLLALWRFSPQQLQKVSS